MSQKSYKETDRFKIRTKDGSLYHVIEITTFLHVNTHSGRNIIPGLKELRTYNDYHVNFDGKELYTIVELGLTGTRE